MKKRRILNRNTANRHSRRSGVTIVESMVAVTLLAVYIAGASRLLMVHRRITDMARAHYTAVNIAKNRVENIRSITQADPDMLFEFREDELTVDRGGFPKANGEYRRSTSISALSGSLGEVAVTVEIRDRRTLGFDGREETLKTLFEY